MQEGFEMCVVFSIVDCCPCSKINGLEGSATLIPLIVLCFFWPHLGCNPSAWSLQVVPAVIKDRIRRQRDSGNPILSWSYFACSLPMDSDVDIRPVLWSCLGDVKPLWPHFLPLFIIMKGFWETLWSPPEKAHSRADASREFYLFFLEHTREKI